MRDTEANFRQRGFTLIELLIVIAIIGILSSLALPNLISSRKAAHERNAIERIRNIVTAQELFKFHQRAGSNRYGTLNELENTPVGHEAIIRWPTPGTHEVTGYHFTDVEAPLATTWCISCEPLDNLEGGDAYFVVTEDGRIRQGATAPTDRATFAGWPQIGVR